MCFHTPPTWSEGKAEEVTWTKTKAKWTSGCFGRRNMSKIVLTWNWFSVFLFFFCCSFGSYQVNMFLIENCSPSSLSWHGPDLFNKNSFTQQIQNKHDEHGPFKWILTITIFSSNLWCSIFYHCHICNFNFFFSWYKHVHLHGIFTFTLKQLFTFPFFSFVCHNFPHFYSQFHEWFSDYRGYSIQYSFFF